MKISGAEFLAQPKKAVTLIGMSGVGKSYTAHKLEQWGWTSYSCDYLIGTDYLDAAMKETLSFEETLGKDNMEFLSSFVGKLGDPARDGLPLEEFQKRQKMYYDAECQSLREMPLALESANGNFVCDSAGSLCEVEDEEIIRKVGEASVVVYLKVKQEAHAEILQRAFEFPKPLYFPPAFLQERLSRYKDKFDLSSVDEIDPLEFLRWIFPHLFEARLPKYQRIADEYGVTLSTQSVSDIKTADEFMQLVADALDG